MCMYFYFIKSDYIIVIFCNYIYGLIFKILNIIIIIDNNKNTVILMLFKYINHLLLLLLLWIAVSALHWQFH